MLAAICPASESTLKASIADTPCGTVVVGTTMTFRSCSAASGTACCAAMMMFLLFGSTKTVEAGVRAMARRMSSVEGFIVCPPVTTASQPRSLRNRDSMPAPALTVTTP